MSKRSHRPPIAIPRGIHPDDVAKIGATSNDVGFFQIGLPLNAPNPLTLISKQDEAFGIWSSLYQPMQTAPEIAIKTRTVVVHCDCVVS